MRWWASSAPAPTRSSPISRWKRRSGFAGTEERLDFGDSRALRRVLVASTGGALVVAVEDRERDDRSVDFHANLRHLHRLVAAAHPPRPFLEPAAMVDEEHREGLRVVGE